ncbi:hypothetical protein [Deinococcus aquaticus]|uniref:GTPase n=1 Tax=Deinococcus aquaticus TaxID=328692 RepID=A0ABY7V3E8_9DEIO|nr:hypothetical protein [Deinococcus aquaticus]WDA58387.1 hypothetical protein M8445_13710 [Deinococcus aquaticus]
MTRPHLLFVYNADGGPLNALKDLWHKTVSPATYDCQLCTVTYGPLGMRREWRDFVRTLPASVTFLHRDELAAQHGVQGVPLPAAFVLDGAQVRPWLSAAQVKEARTLDDLMSLVRDSLPTTGPTAGSTLRPDAAARPA